MQVPSPPRRPRPLGLRPPAAAVRTLVPQSLRDFRSMKTDVLICEFRMSHFNALSCARSVRHELQLMKNRGCEPPHCFAPSRNFVACDRRYGFGVVRDRISGAVGIVDNTVAPLYHRADCGELGVAFPGLDSNLLHDRCNVIGATEATLANPLDDQLIDYRNNVLSGVPGEIAQREFGLAGSARSC